MVAVLVVLFVLVPIAELAVIIRVGHAIGAFNTVGLLLLLSVAGAWLVKREGMSVWKRFRSQVDAGVVPGREIADGVMILLAGALLLAPGFLTDIAGILLLLPPVRAGVRAVALRRATRRANSIRIYRG